MNESAQFVILADGRKLAYTEFGPRNGLPLFWFHGAPSSRLEPLLLGEAAFARLNLRVVAPDRPGIGLSNFQDARCFSNWPSDVAQLADYLNRPRFSILGNSGGSAYVWACAAAIPQRIKAAVIVSGAWRMDATEVKNNLPLANRVFWILAKRFPPGLRILLGTMRRDQQTSRNAELEKMRPHLPPADLAAMSEDGCLEAVQVAIREGLRSGTKGASRDIQLYVQLMGIDFEKVAIPVHLFHGVRDRNVPIILVRKMVRQAQNASLTEFSEDGHLSTLCNHFQEVASCLRAGVDSARD